MTTVVLTFTGGVDSTHLLWRHLTMTADQVIALSVNFGTSIAAGGNLSLGEASAGAKVAQWLKDNVRDFDYRRVEALMTGSEMPSISAARELGKIVQAGEAGKALVAKGHDSNRAARGLRTKRAIERVFQAEAPGGILEFPLWDAGLSKPHAHVELPPALLGLTLKCKNPKLNPDGSIDATCDRCVTGCLYNNLITEKLGQGYSPEAIFDLSQRLMRKGIYEGLPVVHRRWVRKLINTDVYDFPELHD